MKFKSEGTILRIADMPQRRKDHILSFTGQTEFEMCNEFNASQVEMRCGSIVIFGALAKIHSLLSRGMNALKAELHP